MTLIAILGKNTDVIQVVREALREDEWEVRAYPDDHALSPSLRHRRPDLILVDVAPQAGVAGWEVVERLKSDYATASIPLIVSSDNVLDLQNHLDSIQEHVAAVLVRPCTPADVTRCATAALNWGALSRGEVRETRPARPSMEQRGATR